MPDQRFYAHPRITQASVNRYIFLAIAFALDLIALLIFSGLRIEEAESSFFRFRLDWQMHSPRAWLWLSGLIIGQIILVHFALREILRKPEMIMLVPEDRSEGRSFGAFTGPQLISMVDEIADRIGVARPKRLMIAMEPVPNAFTARVLGVGNVVVIHSNLCYILKEAELRAVIAHELGHVARWDSFLSQITNLPKAALWVFQGLLAFSILAGIWRSDDFWTMMHRTMFLFVCFCAFGWMFERLQRAANRATQQAEYLADAIAAHTIGVDPMIQALLRLGERFDALKMLRRSLVPYVKRLGRELTSDEEQRLLNRFPATEVCESRARDLAASLLVAEQLTWVRDSLKVPLDDAEIERLAKQAAITLQAESKNEEVDQADVKRMQAEDEQLIDWRKYDFNRNNELDRKELAKLVKALRDKPTKVMFRTFLKKDIEFEGHPTMKRRLLFLYEVFIEAPIPPEKIGG